MGSSLRLPVIFAAVAALLTASGPAVVLAGDQQGERVRSAKQPVCVDGVAVAAPAGPYSLAVAGSVHFGLVFATHGKVTLGIGRTLWNRIEIDAALRIDRGREFIGIEETASVGVLLPVSLRWTVLLAWRLGYAHFRLSVPGKDRWVGAMVASFLPELRWRMTPRLELRLIPAGISGYWNDVWGAGIEVSTGLAYRF